ncbi:MAG: alpha-amylase family glycosyl hydrolase, partial [Planctomycetota bacterium]
WGAPFQQPAWNDIVLYELHIGTFNDSPGGAPGSFSTATARLDLLADLGVNMIELMPVAEFAGDYSWGYNPAHLFAPESAYGSVDELKALVQAAHDRGIGVMLDVLYNHFGPSDIPHWQFDGTFPGRSGGNYFYDDFRAQTPWGDTRPDYGRTEVRDYIRDNAAYWLNEFRMDGLRLDATAYIRIGPGGDLADGWSIMQAVNADANQSQPWKLITAEDLRNNEWLTKDTGVGGAGFDAQWDAQFVHPVRAAVIDASDASRNMWSVRDAILARYNQDAFERIIYTESHDEVANGRARVPEEIWPGNASSWYSKKRSTLGAAITMTSPGIPMLFQGQEILEDEYFRDTDPVDWNKLTTFGGIRLLYRDLISLRRDLGGVTRGLKGQHVNVHHVNNGAKLIGFHRWDQGGAGDDVIVLANFSSQTFPSYRIGVPRSGQWKLRFNSDWDGYDASFDNHPSVDVDADGIPYDGMSYSIDLSIAPYTALILSQ